MNALLQRCSRSFRHAAPAVPPGLSLAIGLRSASPFRILSTTPRSSPATRAATNPPSPATTLAPTSSLPQYLGYAGALPFLLGGLASTLSGDVYAPAHATQLYGAAILSFLGGVHWGIALRSPGLTLSAARRDYAYGVLPSLAGWGAALAPPAAGLPMLTGGFAVAFVYDSVRFREGAGSGVPAWYRRLRLPLSLAAIAGCALAGRAVRRAEASAQGGVCLREADAVVVSTSAFESGKRVVEERDGEGEGNGK